MSDSKKLPELTELNVEDMGKQFLNLEAGITIFPNGMKGMVLYNKNARMKMLEIFERTFEMQADLVEPEVWIEYLRVDRLGGLVSGCNAIPPKGAHFRSREDVKTGDRIWEWLV